MNGKEKKRVLEKKSNFEMIFVLELMHASDVLSSGIRGAIPFVPLFIQKSFIYKFVYRRISFFFKNYVVSKYPVFKPHPPAIRYVVFKSSQTRFALYSA